MNDLGEKITWGPVAWFGDFLAQHNLTTDRLLIFGLALVILMLVRPGGLFPSRERAAEMHGDDDGHDNEDLYDVMEGEQEFAGGGV
jgi:branched-chain amino acid transport system permease protein